MAQAASVQATMLALPTSLALLQFMAA